MLRAATIDARAAPLGGPPGRPRHRPRRRAPERCPVGPAAHRWRPRAWAPTRAARALISPPVPARSEAPRFSVSHPRADRARRRPSTRRRGRRMARRWSTDRATRASPPRVRRGSAEAGAAASHRHGDRVLVPVADGPVAVRACPRRRLYPRHGLRDQRRGAGAAAARGLRSAEWRRVHSLGADSDLIEPLEQRLDAQCGGMRSRPMRRSSSSCQ